MSNRFNLCIWLLPLRLGSVSFLANLLWTSVVWGQFSIAPNSSISKQTAQASVRQLDQLEKTSTKAFADYVPAYEAFSMGGSETVRGYKNGEVGTGSSFIMTSAEYRFPIANDLHILSDRFSTIF